MLTSKGLASNILSRISCQLPNDWQQRYGFRQVLLETFGESPRRRGPCYKAENWVNVGKTKGRGKKRPHQGHLLCPLRQNFRAVLDQQLTGFDYLLTGSPNTFDIDTDRHQKSTTSS